MRLAAPRTDVGGWILRAGIGAIFVFAGLDKFDGSPNGEWVRIFARIGLGQWFRIATGAIEVGGGVLLVFPWTTRAGAALLAATMFGAMLAHLTVLGDPFASVVPAVLGVAAVAVALREPDYDPRTVFRRGGGRP